ncbi:MAG: hypothetical protein LBJ04_22805 [Sphingobacterium sp.]|jgi:hypothetical protein|nr:hypothetical protein [Sphingobacterium sp.]
MEFKGTKGKFSFEIDEFHDLATIESNLVKNGPICEVRITDSNLSEVPYDFNLMAHSKEMLEMLKILIQDIEDGGNYSRQTGYDLEEAKKLIESATTI